MMRPLQKISQITKSKSKKMKYHHFYTHTNKHIHTHTLSLSLALTHTISHTHDLCLFMSRHLSRIWWQKVNVLSGSFWQIARLWKKKYEESEQEGFNLQISCCILLKKFFPIIQLYVQFRCTLLFCRKLKRLSRCKQEQKRKFKETLLLQILKEEENDYI
jgi:hypothetical protein